MAILRDANSTLWGHSSNALLRTNNHDTFQSKDQLILRMEGAGNHMSIFKVTRHASDLGQRLTPPVQKEAVALLRHFLSQWQKILEASTIPQCRKATGEAGMLTSSKMIGFVLTKDYDKARAFFEGKLGFQFVSVDQYALAMRAGGNTIRIAKVPDFTPAQSTVLGWEVQEIEAVVTWLKERGVTFEKYPFVQDRELGIWTAPTGDKVAWFKDPDGNVLSVSQHNESASR